ncbi:MAG: DUF3237 domain-containing protein [Rudaea sp.]|uniref:DUF3237 domain-containing protein n=1 Tax=unclassified Rudaea TaxID=2627037 RepID=UPI0010F6484D|nr:MULTISPECIES: DUF3237 domain-containing protein [unclassified Rudaea]MBN8887109.1 DUF3237 domain-containing protein [Rudaea sp.]MBR0345931.1 DUF3237 domain-containing protein [Rudaea sp.]
MFKYEMEHLFSFTGSLAPPELIGPVPEGIRGNFYITGGEVKGPRLNGKVRPVGCDWFHLRRDGIGGPDVRTTIEADDGALIYVEYAGFADMGEDGYEKMARGELPAKLPLKNRVLARTAHPQYQWLHRAFAISIGEFDLATLSASYDVYAVR